MKRKQASKSVRGKKSDLHLERLEGRMLLSGMGWGMSTDQIGDTIKTAYSLTPDDSGDAGVSSQIDTSRDQDIFAITAAGTGTMTIDMTTPDSTLDSYLYIYNSRGKLIAQDDDSGTDTDAQVTMNVTEGTVYYIRADAWKWSTGSYTLVINGPVPGAVYTDDFGDTQDAATPIDLGDDGSAEQAGEIGWAGDQDLFSVTAAGAGMMTITMETPDSNLDSYLYVFDSDGKLVARDDDSGEDTDAQITIEATAGETYYIQADAWRTSIGSYTLRIAGPADSTSEDHDSEGQDAPDNGATTEAADGVTEGWAVLIGSWDYEGTENDLQECALDVTMMESVLIEEYGFSTTSIHTLTGGGGTVTATAVTAELDWLTANADGDDILLFYYTGHGSSGQNVFMNDTESLYLASGEYYTETLLSTQLSEMNADATKIIVLDTCYSGGFTGLGNTIANTSVFASSSYNQTSWGAVSWFLPSGSSGSVFTSWLVTAMRDSGSLGVDSNSNGRISLNEAFSYADQNIRRLTRGRYYQDPAMSAETEEIEIVLG